MEISMLDAAGQALMMIADPYRLMFLSFGVVVGLVLGILPGVGGITGMALLLPFTFAMDAYTAFAFLLGLAAVGSTSDTIPAVLFGVPGSSGSQATVLDGLPMSKKGEAGRALSAAYMASLMGGLFGAFLLAMAIPLLRPIMLYIGSPELLAFSVFGISMVAVLSGNAPLRGLTAAGLGVMFSMIGSDPQTGTMRWTLDTLYLWEGLPLVPMVLGLFALPELCDLATRRTSITSSSKFNVRAGMWQGMKDAFRNWWLVMRCGTLGAGIGAIPGLGSSVVDWFAYGHAVRTEKNAQRTFGTGDVRGVIAPESANNAKDGGGLVPTIAFGVPGSASMAILLGAFLIHGLVPGPDMLTVNLEITYAMIWSVAIANILGAGLCFMFSGFFAKLATMRYTLILPVIMSIMYVGAFQANRDWGDLYTLLLFGLLGWTMKRMKWPRPPLILGFVLGAIIETYMFISINRYGADWLARPVVIVLLALAFMGLFRAFMQDVRIQGGLRAMSRSFGKPTFRGTDLFYVFVLGLVALMGSQALGWSFAAKIAPLIVTGLALTFGLLSLANQIFRRPVEKPVAGPAEETSASGSGSANEEKIYMDVATDFTGLSVGDVLFRAGTFFGWLVGFMASMATFGLLPTVPLFLTLYMRLENREKWHLVIPMAIGLTIFVYFVFDQMLTIPWPSTLIGGWFPELRVIPSV